ncbi:hypothetical protein ACFPT7_11920 [Acidicapsa dinghuensis]|uniref:Uncharacterized protein n=1 Tax=Acidicapsa dinghuensis TaxID=2218256 RepID=A0ABW1EI06_9BACT|nr:hypothetical protein [Acidicapsa dinghuensis]
MSLSLLSMITVNGSVAVDTVRLGLESDSARWFSVVKYSGYAVALGCALEAPETFHILKRWWLLRFRGENREESINEKRSWLVPAAAAGLLAIVLGIFLETYAEGRVSDLDAQLRAHESDKITAAESDASEAKTRAAKLETSNKQLGIELEKSKAENLAKERELDAAQRKTAEVQKSAAAAFTVFVRRTGERLLNIEKFAKEMKPFPRKDVEIWYTDDDPEAKKFAEDVWAGALNAWGRPVPTLRVRKPFDMVCNQIEGGQPGITVIAHDSSGYTGTNSFGVTLARNLLVFPPTWVGTPCDKLPVNKIIVNIGVRDRM